MELCDNAAYVQRSHFIVTILSYQRIKIRPSCRRYNDSNCWCTYFMVQITYTLDCCLENGDIRLQCDRQQCYMFCARVLTGHYLTSLRVTYALVVLYSRKTHYVSHH